MADTLLPEAEFLDKASSYVLNTTYDGQKARSVSTGRLIVVSWLALLGFLALAQILLDRRFRQVLNLGLVLATVIALVSGGVTLRRLDASSAHLADAREQAFQSVHAGPSAPVVLARRRRASSSSIRHRRGAQLDFGHQVSRLLRMEGEDVVDLAVDGKIPEGAAGYLAGVAGPGAAGTDPESARNVVLAFEAFLTEDTTMRRLVNTDEPEAAVDEYTNGQAYADLDAAITAAQAIEQGTFDEAADAAEDAAAPLDVLNLLARRILLLAQLGLFSVSGSTGHELRNRARPFNPGDAGRAGHRRRRWPDARKHRPQPVPRAIPEHEENTLVIEGDAWSGYAPFRDEGLLDGTGYTALYVEQVCQDVRAADLTAGRADIIVTTLDQYLLEHPEGTVVGIIDPERRCRRPRPRHRPPRARQHRRRPGLVAREAEVGGKPVLAYTGNSPSEMLLNELVNTTDELRLTDFELVSVDQSATALEMLQADEAQLAIIWEPDTSAARAAGNTIALSSGRPRLDRGRVRGQWPTDRARPRCRASGRGLLLLNDGRPPGPPGGTGGVLAADGGLDIATVGTLLSGIKLYGTGDADTFLNDEIFPLDKPQILQSIDSIGSVLALVHPDIPLDQAEVDGNSSARLPDRRNGRDESGGARGMSELRRTAIDHAGHGGRGT